MKRAVYDGDETEGAGAKEVERRVNVNVNPGCERR